MDRFIHKPVTTQSCTQCMADGHDRDALFCKHCAAQLNPLDKEGRV